MRRELSLPALRVELVSILESLSNPDYQEAAWIGHEFPEGIEHDEFDYAVHFLYDDTSLGDGAAQSIGVFLHKDEAKAVDEVVCALNAVFDECGLGATDERYVHANGWRAVVEKASAALALIRKNDQA